MAHHGAACATRGWCLRSGVWRRRTKRHVTGLCFGCAGPTPPGLVVVMVYSSTLCFEHTWASLRCYIKAFSFWAWPAVGDIGSKLSSSTSSSESHDAVGPGSSRPTSELPRKDGADLFPRTRRMRTHLRQSLPHAAAAHSLCDSAPQDEHCVIRSSSHRNSRSSEPQISQQCPFSWQRRHLPSTWPSETLVTLDTHTLLYLS